MSKQESKKKLRTKKSEPTIEQKIASNEWPSINPLPLTPEEKQWIDTNLTEANDKLSYIERKEISKIHSRTFLHKFTVPCTCNPKLYKQWKSELLRLSSLH